MIVDLVPNHTSSEHAWFQAALASVPGSPERARYLFRDGKGPRGEEPPNNWRSVFGGPAWTRVPDGQWYLHLFDTSQPDLDWRNPEVGDLFEDVLRFWLDRGVDGFRVDVAHGLLKEATLRDQIVADGEQPGSGVELFETFSMAERALRDEPMWDQPEVHDVYRRWHKVLAEYPGRPDDRGRGLDPDPRVDGPVRPRRRDEPGVQLLLAARTLVGARRSRTSSAAPSRSSPRSTPRRRGC